jgi:hypothetical protein
VGRSTYAACDWMPCAWCKPDMHGAGNYFSKKSYKPVSYVSIRQHTSAYVSIRQHTSAYVSIRQHTSAYVSIRQQTSADVSIRQHTSADVSRRQHTSAYVSIRQHTSAWPTCMVQATTCPKRVKSLCRFPSCPLHDFGCMILVCV